MATIVLAGCLLTLLATFFLTPTFLATTTFTSASSIADEGSTRALGFLQGMVGSLGINLGAGQDLSLMYPHMIRSREFLSRVLGMEVKLSDGSHETLSAWIDPSGDTDVERMDKAFRELRDKIRIHVDSRTGIIELSVEFRDPAVASSVANECVARLDALAREMRRTHTSSKSQFVDRRLQETGVQLSESENDLLEYRERNRSLSGSPQLLLGENRLQRKVELYERLHQELVVQQELNQIDVARDVPLVVVLDRAVPPITRFSPKRFRLMVSAAILSFFAGSMIVLLRKGRREVVVDS